MMVDLNIDIGEGGTCDEALLALASSANIACGGHAGGGEIMRTAIRQAQAAGVAVGAHPGYRDRANFGRVETGESVTVIEREVRCQLMDFCEALGAPAQHIKLHGALYHRANHDAEVARAICHLVMNLIPEAWVFAFATGGLAKVAAQCGLQNCPEGFVDRGYGRDGCLIPRSEPGAMIDSPTVAAAQAVQLAESGSIQTLCVHGDGLHALEVLRCSREALVNAGWTIAPPAIMENNSLANLMTR